MFSSLSILATWLANLGGERSNMYKQSFEQLDSKCHKYDNRKCNVVVCRLRGVQTSSKNQRPSYTLNYLKYYTDRLVATFFFSSSRVERTRFLESRWLEEMYEARGADGEKYKGKNHSKQTSRRLRRHRVT